MTIKFEKIKPGMVLYDVRKADWRTRMATGRSYSFWTVSVVTVNPTDRRVLASWNGNAPKWMDERNVTQFRASLPKKSK